MPSSLIVAAPLVSSSSAILKLSSFPSEYFGAMDNSLGSLLPSGNDDGLLCSQVDDSFDDNHDRVVVSHHDDVLLPGAHDDGNLDVLLPGAHDVIDGNLHCNQDGAHAGAVIAQQDGSHDWLNELDDEDFSELSSSDGTGHILRWKQSAARA
ncbi:hypothetical protein ABZP36_026750 [Zizania latifolia]